MIEGSEVYQRWLQARVGKCTASRIRDVVATLKNGGYGIGRERYRAELIAERQTGVPYQSYVSPQMRWGNDTQPQATAAFELFTGQSVLLPEDVWEDGFVPHPFVVMAGASPDGAVGKQGLIEIKCPDTHTHVATLRGGSIPVEYVDQMLFQMACSGRKWCDWVSFDPRMRPDRQLFVRRIYRDDARIKELEIEAQLFLAEVAAECDAIDRLDADFLIYNVPKYQKEKVG